MSKHSRTIIQHTIINNAKLILPKPHPQCKRKLAVQIKEKEIGERKRREEMSMKTYRTK